MNKSRQDASDQDASDKAKSPPHPGMLGDETEEQNLNQPGNPKARISRDEVEDAFKGPPADKPDNG